MDLGETSRQSLQRSTALWVGVVLVAVLVGIVNYFGWKYHQRFDWTASRLYTLSEKSESVLATLDRDVEAIVLMDTGDELYAPVTELLSRYDAASSRFSVRRVDAQKNLLEAQQLVDRFELSRLNVVVLDSEQGRRVIDAVDLADYDYSGMQMGQAPQMSGFKGESAFTSALLDLMESRKPKILFTSGHGELQLDDFSPRGLSALSDLLGKDNFEMEEWPLLGQTATPGDADLIVIAGPTSTFVAPELALLRTHLEGGGRLLVMIDPTLDETGMVSTGLEGLLADFGVTVGDDIVVDPANPLPFFGAETIFIGSYGDHVITRPLDQAQLPVIVPLGRSVTAAQTPGLEIIELLRTSGEGWGETDLANLDRVELGDTDLGGPVPLGVAVEHAAEETAEGAVGEFEPAAQPEEAGPAVEPALEPAVDSGAEATTLRLVVLGDSDLASNGQLQGAPNATFIANTMNWLVERETLVAIPPKKPEQVRLSLTGAELRGITWTVLGLLPGAALAAGVAVYRKRRR
ncbi:MAG: GldG family protein [Thermoanaerobaculia bacterium]